jgi:hypothetical protein
VQNFQAQREDIEGGQRARPVPGELLKVIREIGAFKVVGSSQDRI